MRLHNNVARRMIADSVAADTSGGRGSTGRGEIVAVADSGLDNGKIPTTHPDFHGRVRHIESFPIRKSLATYVVNPGADDGAADDVSGHGTHVAGSIVGNGAVAQNLPPDVAQKLGGSPFKGTAPGAELVFQAIGQYVMWQRGFVLGDIRH